MAASVVAASVLASLNPGHIVNDGLNTTGNQTVQVTHCDEGGDGGGFLIGVGMGVVGSVLINIGQNLQATAMQSSPEVASKPCTSKTWITGLSVFVCGSLLNFLAFTFASASILVPIEAVQFVVNVIYGKYVNKKAISNRMLLGVTITIGGTVLCVTFGSSDTRCFTLGDMEAFWLQPLWWIYLLVSFSVAFFALSINRSYTRQLAIGGSPKHHVYVLPVTFAVSSALLGGGQMIVHSKAIAELFELQVQMIEPLPVTTWYFYLEFTLLATGGAFWLFKMNESLGMFDPLFIIPLLQSCYILFGVIAGGIYFEEFAGLHNGPAGWLAWPFFVLGMSGVLFGLYLIAPPVDADGGRKANGGADGVTMTISSSTHGALSGRNRVYSSEPHDETALEIYPSIDKPGPPIASYSSGVESSGSAGSKGHARKPSGNHAISGRHSRTPSQSAAQCAEISVQLEEADGMQGVLADSLDQKSAARLAAPKARGVAENAGNVAPGAAGKRKAVGPPAEEAKPTKRPSASSRALPANGHLQAAAAAKAAAARQQPKAVVSQPKAPLQRSATMPGKSDAGHEMQLALQVANEELDSLTMANEQLNARFEAEKTEHTVQIEDMRVQLEAANSAMEDECRARKEEQRKVREANEALEKRNAEFATLSTRAHELEAACASAVELERELTAQRGALEERLAQREAELEELAVRGREAEELRRTMHETISELKGNIRVFCRVRPQGPAPADGEAGARSLVRIPTGQLEPTALELVPPAANEEASSKAARKAEACRFKFDRVFQESAKQGDIFREVSQLTQSAIDGYKVCIFAYGQTGSGKTFTMEGRRGDRELRGVVPRAAEQVFSSAAQLALLGWAFSFRASFLEIYNDELRDLLPAGADADPKAKLAPAKLKVVDNGTEVQVPNLRSIPVADAAALEKLMDAASRVRSTAATKMNEHSSRSHYIFRMHLSGVNEATGAVSEGELNLIDLAGSERTKESGVTGEAMREANHINKSLTSLGDVIAAMSAKESHVPFRNSTLTHVLKNALSGSAKTLMFVNVSPASKHHQESLSSLRFAAKVNNTETGKAEKKGKASN